MTQLLVDQLLLWEVLKEFYYGLKVMGMKNT